MQAPSSRAQCSGEGRLASAPRPRLQLCNRFLCCGHCLPGSSTEPQFPVLPSFHGCESHTTLLLPPSYIPIISFSDFLLSSLLKSSPCRLRPLRISQAFQTSSRRQAPATPPRLSSRVLPSYRTTNPSLNAPLWLFLNCPPGRSDIAGGGLSERHFPGIDARTLLPARRRLPAMSSMFRLPLRRVQVSTICELQQR